MIYKVLLSFSHDGFPIVTMRPGNDKDLDGSFSTASLGDYVEDLDKFFCPLKPTDERSGYQPARSYLLELKQNIDVIKA